MRFLLRAFVQLIIMFLVILLLTLILQLLHILKIIPSITTDTMLGRFMISLFIFAGVLVSMWLGGRWLDRRRLSNFGLHLSENWRQDLIFGLVLGVVLITLVFIFEWVAGLITISGTFQSPQGMPFVIGIILATSIYLSVGIYEELFFRGYYLTNIAEWLGHFKFIQSRWAVIAALVITSLVFGIAHAMNPNASVVSTINITLVALLLLGLGYILTGELAISIGIHITWNLFQGSVFGFPVSGMDSGQTSFIAITQNGPDWLTGGSFGPEAGLLGVLATLLGCAITIWWVKYKTGKADICESIAEAPRDFYREQILS